MSMDLSVFKAMYPRVYAAVVGMLKTGYAHSQIAEEWNLSESTVTAIADDLSERRSAIPATTICVAVDEKEFLRAPEVPPAVPAIPRNLCRDTCMLDFRLAYAHSMDFASRYEAMLHHAQRLEIALNQAREDLARGHAGVLARLAARFVSIWNGFTRKQP
jgi:hypothetical protein